jgi:hypothetical protein
MAIIHRDIDPRTRPLLDRGATDDSSVATESVVHSEPDRFVERTSQGPRVQADLPRWRQEIPGRDSTGSPNPCFLVVLSTSSVVTQQIEPN